MCMSHVISQKSRVTSHLIGARHESQVMSHNISLTNRTSHRSQAPVTSPKSPVTSHQSPVTSHQLQVISHQLQVTSHHLQVTSHHLQVTTYKLQVTTYKSPVTSYKSPLTSHHLLQYVLMLLLSLCFALFLTEKLCTSRPVTCQSWFGT